MILVGNSRGSAHGLATHLLNTHDNEHVHVHEVSGFISDTLTGALNEAYGVSRGTKCQQFLFSLSLNPPKNESVDVEGFESAVEQAEEKLGLSGQPRAIVFHEKIGTDGQMRRHCHAVWSRIDAAEMKAVPLPFHKRRLQDVSRNLYREHGWDLPRGHQNPIERDPHNFTLAEWQQAKRAKQDPKVLKALFQDCWSRSDSQTAFAHALKERSYILARGDRRGFVAVDYKGEVYSVSKWVGVKAKETRARLGEPHGLPNVETAHGQAAPMITDRLNALRRNQESKKEFNLSRLETERLRKAEAHKQQEQALTQDQMERQQREDIQRQAKLRNGFFGLVDRVTGKRKRTKQENRLDAARALERDKQERQKQQQAHRKAQKATARKQANITRKSEATIQELKGDIKAVQAPIADARVERKRTFVEKRKSERSEEQSRTRNRGPTPRR